MYCRLSLLFDMHMNYRNDAYKFRFRLGVMYVYGRFMVQKLSVFQYPSKYMVMFVAVMIELVNVVLDNRSWVILL